MVAERIGPKHYLDFIVDQLVTISSLTAEFTEKRGDGTGYSMELERMMEESLVVLRRLEIVLAHMQTSIGTLADDGDVPGSMRDFVAPHRGPFWGKPLEYNLTSLCRTAAVTLRLLMCDFIREGQQPEGRVKLAEQRKALMAHVGAILGLIPYSSRGEIFEFAPLCFVPAFRMAKAVLARESDALQAERGRDDEAVARCMAMEELIQRHLDFVSSRKIAIKVDIPSLV